MLYGITISARDLATPSKPVIAAIGDANGIVAQKQLHAFDPDFYLTLRARATGAATLRISDGYGVAITEVLGGGPPPPTNLQLKV